MGKITDYGRVSTLDSSNVLLLDGSAGTKTVLASSLLKALAEMPGSGMHASIVGGRNLGSSLTAAQLASITDGTFEGMLVGDYWVIGNVAWRIVDIDYWYGQGDTEFTKHHLAIMPDTALCNAVMNDSNTTEGGYTGSKMYTENLDSAKATVASAFGSAVLTHREYLVNAVTNGKPSGGAWVDSSVELPNEIQMYGCHVFSPGGDGSSVPTKYTIDKSQFALFSLEKHFINPNRQSQWLRDVVSGTDFAYVNYFGGANCLSASISTGVRPVFPIGG